MALIREALRHDCTDWLQLWDGYNRFSETTVAPEVTNHTWERILDPAQPLVGRVAEHDGRLVGMSISIEHLGTWSKSPTLYLEDLFVDPEVRGVGIGRALMTDVVEQAKARGCHCLY